MQNLLTKFFYFCQQVFTMSSIPSFKAACISSANQCFSLYNVFVVQGHFPL